MHPSAPDSIAGETSKSILGLVLYRCNIFHIQGTTLGQMTMPADMIQIGISTGTSSFPSTAGE
jgi:hypothetical protein